MTYGMSPSSGPSTGGGSPTGSFREKRPHGYQRFALQQFTPEMMQLYGSLFPHFGPESFLSRLASGEPGAFEQMEAPAHRQFQEKLGDISSRFSGMGMGARKGSGFQTAANQAASDFAMQLQANRLGLTRQALNDLVNMSNVLLSQRPYEQGYVKKDRGGMDAEAWGRLAGAIPGTISALRGGGSFSDAFKGAASIFGGGGGSSAPAYDQLFRMTGVAPY